MARNGFLTVKAQAVAWESPANIAIVKYWGKKGFQIPANPSVSFTLTKCKTITSIISETRPKSDEDISFEYFFEGKKIDSFNRKIEQYLRQIVPCLPFLSRRHLTIKSHNTFPHSAGMASSASSMSALALCLLDLQHTDNAQNFIAQASRLSRIGSGSACRSLHPYAALWGECSGGNDQYAVPITDVHQTFKSYQDSVLIVSNREKSIPSRAGHQSMQNHPYKKQRYKLATERAADTLNFLKEGNEEALGGVLEQEALELHALAATAMPSSLYLEPNALRIIKHIRQFRHDTGLPLYFSLDAGTNIHLLYPDRTKQTVRAFIESNLKSLLEEPFVIHDQVGEGPRKLQ